MKIRKDIEQRTFEWHEMKAGKPSASNISVINYKEPQYYAESNKEKAGQLKYPGGWSDGSQTYALDLLGERICGPDENDSYVSYAMQRGIDLEPEARKIYEDFKKVTVHEVGGIEANGCWYSPDGLVGNDGLIEIKCPDRKRHLQTLLSGKIPDDNLDQCAFGLWISGRQWIDFISYNPDFGLEYCAKIIRLNRSECTWFFENWNGLIPKFIDYIDKLERKLLAI